MSWSGTASPGDICLPDLTFSSLTFYTVAASRLTPLGCTAECRRSNLRFGRSGPQRVEPSPALRLLRLRSLAMITPKRCCHCEPSSARNLGLGVSDPQRGASLPSPLNCSFPPANQFAGCRSQTCPGRLKKIFQSAFSGFGFLTSLGIDPQADWENLKP